MGWREGPQREYRHGIFMAYFHQSLEDPEEGLLIWHQLNLINGVSPSQSWQRAARRQGGGDEAQKTLATVVPRCRGMTGGPQSL